MRNIFNLDAPIIQWLSKLSWLLWMACLWFVCCLPVVTIGASTAALYRVAFNLREEGAHSAQTFFRAFRENFRQATLLWLILALAGGILAAVYIGALALEAAAVRLTVVLVFCAGFVLWGFVFLYGFPLTAYFENTLKNTLVNCLAMSIKHLRQTVLCFALAVIPVTALLISPYWFLRLMYIWLLIYPALASYWITGILSRVFSQYIKDE